MIKLNLLIRSCFFSLGYITYTILFGVFVIPFCLVTWPILSFDKRFALITSWVDVVMWWLSVTCNIRYEVVGEENIPDKACVVISNHQSTWETFYLYKIFKPQSTLLKRELLWIPLFGWGLKMLNPIAVNRSKKHNALKQLVAEGSKRIADGFWFIGYPEGTRVAVDKKVPYASGISMLASKSQAPVLPVAHNAGYHWPKRTIIKHPGTIKLVIGRTISSEDKSPKELTREVEKWIRATQEEINPV